LVISRFCFVRELQPVMLLRKLCSLLFASCNARGVSKTLALGLYTRGFVVMQLN
jgi:hypothetical protein